MKQFLCKPKILLSGIILVLLAVVPFVGAGGRYISGIIWPEPPVVTPGDGTAPPSDAVVLFDGKGFEEWDGGEKQKVDDDGAFSIRGGMRTKKKFGDCQLHVEFATPEKVKGTGQQRGNNGIGLMGGRYEIQILDSYKNKTYFEGQCASVYNQRPPAVNACRGPGEWQTFDIFFTAPRFEKDGKLKSPAYVSVVHNGVLVQNHTELQGMTRYNRKPTYSKHGEREQLVLMYHGNQVRFRNIWIRDFAELQGKWPKKK